MERVSLLQKTSIVTRVLVQRSQQIKSGHSLQKSNDENQESSLSMPTPEGREIQAPWPCDGPHEGENELA